jgi:hypothetical protein
MASQEEIIIIGKLRVIKNYFEKTYITGASLLWLIATFWDIYKLQRYWFDYAIEIYTSFLVFLMMLYSIYPKAIPYKIYESFKIITKIKGRGILLLLISFLFLGDNHQFHRMCAIVLLVAGLLCFICEILIPTTKEELMKISEKFDKNRQNKANNAVEIKNNFENINNLGEKQFEYDNSNNVEKIDDEIKENNNIDSNENNNKKIHEVEEKLDGGATSAEEKLHNNINNQSSNPYDLPDDF